MVRLKGRIPPYDATVACLGVKHSPLRMQLGGRTIPALLPWMHRDNLVWHPKNGLRYGIFDVPAGTHLVFFHHGHRYFDWRWVEIKADPRSTVPEIDFTLQPSLTGKVAVTVADPTIERVLFALADDQGTVPKWSIRLVGKSLSEDVKDGKALFSGLRPGKYVFYAPDAGTTGRFRHGSRFGSKKSGYVYTVPRWLTLTENAPPKIRRSVEAKAKQTTRIELK